MHQGWYISIQAELGHCDIHFPLERLTFEFTCDFICQQLYMVGLICGGNEANFANVPWRMPFPITANTFTESLNYKASTNTKQVQNKSQKHTKNYIAKMSMDQQHR